VVVLAVVGVEVSELSPGAAQSGRRTPVGGPPGDDEPPGGSPPFARVDNVISLFWVLLMESPRTPSGRTKSMPHAPTFIAFET
jgi:hypothetical protein